jgi:hypothetical protein
MVWVEIYYDNEKNDFYLVYPQLKKSVLMFWCAPIETDPGFLERRNLIPIIGFDTDKPKKSKHTPL